MFVINDTNWTNNSGLIESSLFNLESWIWLLTLFPWYQVISGGGTEYKLMAHVRLMVLPALTYTADSPKSFALAAENKEEKEHLVYIKKQHFGPFILAVVTG